MRLDASLISDQMIPEIGAGEAARGPIASSGMIDYDG